MPPSLYLPVSKHKAQIGGTVNLTDAKIRAAKPGPKPRKISDGHGLFLMVTPAGGKLWRFKYRFLGK